MIGTVILRMTVTIFLLSLEFSVATKLLQMAKAANDKGRKDAWWRKPAEVLILAVLLVAVVFTFVWFVIA